MGLMKIGADFNSSAPTDSANVRHPTAAQMGTELRDLRSRLKAFWGVLFNIESGDLKDDVVPMQAWVDHPGKPATGNRWATSMTVDKRGFITGVGYDTVLNGARTMRAWYTADGGWHETDTGIVREEPPGLSNWPTGHVLPNSGDIGWVQQGYVYQFTVPADVTRLKATLIGGGLSDGDASTVGRSPDGIGSGGAPRKALIAITLTAIVTPKKQLKVWVGAERSASFLSNQDYTAYMTSWGYSLGVPEMASQLPLVQSKSPYAGYGDVGQAGAVLLEWAA